VSILISWAMIVTMLIYIYPLKAIFSSMWFSSAAVASVTCSARILNGKSALSSRSSHWASPLSHWRWCF